MVQVQLLCMWAIRGLRQWRALSCVSVDRQLLVEHHLMATGIKWWQCRHQTLQHMIASADRSDAAYAHKLKTVGFMNLRRYMHWKLQSLVASPISPQQQLVGDEYSGNLYRKWKARQQLEQQTMQQVLCERYVSAM